MTPQIYILKLSRLTVRLEITEKPKAIMVLFSHDKFGGVDDGKKVREWATGVLARYDGDRPIVFTNQNSGDVKTFVKPTIFE